MSGFDPIRSPGPLRERLYALLPAVYRSRDVANGEPLRALMAVLEAELEAMRADVDTTYDNWFVETCEEWVLPYLAASLGVHALRPVDGDVVSLRAYVANTLAYRRRKGTAAVLEQLAQDLTGFRARVVEYFRRTATTVHMQRVRERGQVPAMGGTVDLRDAERLQRIATGHGAFDPHAHTGEVRLISTGRGRYNLPNLGLHVWRVHSFEVNRATARPIEGEPGWYRIDPHGFDGPVYNVPQTEQSITSLAEEIHVPHALTRLALYADLQVPESERRYLGADPALEVRVISGGTESGPWPLQICNLADGPSGLPSRRPPTDVVAVDPELGRLVFSPDNLPPVDAGPMEVQVDHAYGSPAMVGAGTFDRSEAWREQIGDHALTWIRYVTRHPILASELSAESELEGAVAAWNAHVADAAGPAVGCIVILGGRTRPGMPAIAPESRSYAAPSSTISLPGGSRLYIVSASVDRQPEDDGSGLRTTIVPNRVRTPIYGDLVVAGTTGDEDASHRGGLLLNGLSVEGRIRVEPGELGTLDLAHCTVATPPGSSSGPGGIDVGSAPGQTNATLELRLFASVCGPIAAASDATSLHLHDSVVHGDALDSNVAVDLPATALHIEGSTVLGGTIGRTLEASNSLLDGPLVIEQHQQGCVRFCYAPPGAKSPRRHRCQPDLALEGIDDAGQRAIVISRVQPGYVSTDHRHPAHALLRPGTPIEIRTGAEDGGELGVYHHLQYARRLANLHQALRQYLRFGLEVGVFAES